MDDKLSGGHLLSAIDDRQPKSLRLRTKAVASEHDVAIVDELGKMELASPSFREAFSALLDRRVPVVATVQSAPHPFTMCSSDDAISSSYS